MEVLQTIFGLFVVLLMIYVFLFAPIAALSSYYLLRVLNNPRWSAGAVAYYVLSTIGLVIFVYSRNAETKSHMDSGIDILVYMLAAYLNIAGLMTALPARALYNAYAERLRQPMLVDAVGVALFVAIFAFQLMSGWLYHLGRH